MPGWRKRAFAATAALLAALCAGCGSVGDPLPPALKRPVPVTDLEAVERGASLVVQFTIPTETTENLPVQPHPDIELRVGPADADGFHLESWLMTSDRIPVAGDSPVARVPIPAAKYVGKTVFVGVNVHGPKGRTAGWSTFKTVPVVAPLAKPEGLEPSNAPDAVHLEWHGPAGEYRVFRKIPEAEDWAQVATSRQQSWTDASIEYGKTYQYRVQATEKTGDTWAESDISEAVTFKPEDRFAPSVPTGFTAVPGVRAIELVWDRNTEKDFAGYNLYRNGIKLAGGLSAPSYSDKDVQPGVRYEYQVSAMDTAGNESAKTSVTPVSLP